MKTFIGSRTIWNYMQNQFKMVMDGTIHCWDSRRTHAYCKRRGLSNVPSMNLVTNIGFGESATHAQNTNTSHTNLHLYPIKSPLTQPEKRALNRGADWLIHRNAFDSVSLRFRLGGLKRKAFGQN